MFLHLGLLIAMVLVFSFVVGGSGRRLRRRIRQLKEENQQLTQHQEQVDAMLDAMRDVVVRLDQQGEVLQANDKGRRLLGFKIDVIQGEKTMVGGDELHSVTQMAWGPKWRQQMEQALQRLPQPTHFSALEIDYNGGEHMVLDPALVPLGEDQALFLASDISATMEQQREKEALFANLMHDLKTPITSLIGYSNGLQTMGDDPEMRHHALGAIGRAAKRVNRLFDALLALYSAEEAAVTSGESDLAQVSALVMDGLYDQAKEAQVELLLTVSDISTVVSMPADAAERVLTNVVENAITHSPVGGKVEIVLSQQDQRLCVVVCDDGCGVSQEKIPHLTERFYRVDTARSSSDGHGLGLAIVDELLTNYGGDMAISNRLPAGLQVKIHIPLGNYSAAALHTLSGQ
ncbi:MAG: ATP-binding protein [Mariprofundales bacterium]